MCQPILVATGVRKTVRDGARLVTILDGVDLELTMGERVALMGPSGSGKSTLLHILGTLDVAFEGEVHITGQSVRACSDRALSALRNREIGFVFQSYNLLGHLSALENVWLPARFGDRPPDHDRALRVLDSVGLGGKNEQRPHTLSGGERQRVAIARALYNQPNLVLCDEPTGNLDQATGASILSLFTRLTDAGAALLVATHDVSIADGSDRILSLKDGKLGGMRGSVR